MSGTKLLFGVVALSLLGSGPVFAQDASETPPMTFFLASMGSGDGADLGALAGADAHCQMLADGAGAGDHTWRAYLSTQGPNAVNARDRIARAHGITRGAFLWARTSMKFTAWDIGLRP